MSDQLGAHWRALVRWIDTADAKRLALILFSTAFLLRLLLTVALYLTSLWAGRRGFIVLGFDAYNYDRYAWIIGRAFRSGEFVSISGRAGTTDVLYFYLLGGLYALIGHVPLVGRIVGAAAGALVPLLTWGIGRETFDETVARRAAAFTAVFPNLVYWSAYDLLKDPIIWVILLGAVYAALLIRRQSWLAVLATPILLLAMRSIRGQFGLLIVVAVIVFLVLLMAQERRLLPHAVVALVLIFAVEAGLRGGVAPMQWVANEVSSTKSVVVSMNTTETGRPEVVTFGEMFKEPLAAGPRLAKGFTIFTLGPFAWYVPPRFTYDVLLYPGMWIWYLLLPFALFGVASAIREPTPQKMLLFLIVLEIFLGYGLYLNSGAFRQREQMTPMLALFGAVGLAEPRRKRVLWLWYGAIAGLAVGHILYRAI